MVNFVAQSRPVILAGFFDSLLSTTEGKEPEPASATRLTPEAFEQKTG
jgi:hypothetical protein